MKIKISKNRAGETLVDYLNVSDKNSFRFHLLKKILDSNNNDAVIMVDTNQRVTERSGLGVLEGLHEAGENPLAIQILSNPQKFFGFDLNMWNKGIAEYLIALKLNGRSFTKEIYEPISGCDISIGMGQTQPIENQYGIIGANSALILNTCFEHRIYDSIICTRIKSNVDISGYVGEVTHEMGL